MIHLIKQLFCNKSTLFSINSWISSRTSVLFFFLLLFSNCSYSQEKITHIQIWSAPTNHPFTNYILPSKYLLIADSVVYNKSRFRKKVLNDSDSILFFVQDRLVFDAIYQKNNHPCSLYEKSIFVQFNVIEESVRSFYIYQFSYPIKCKESSDTQFFNLFYEQIVQLKNR